ncbi:MAG: tRNA (cytidine(34)-2'-O)-methyltransferase [Peptostreptococcaceae bacterium]|nr:tRNA (cytidine(34)-2'-O)-methyltransferase [Peptostreptococcaceae bacterium]
MHIVLFQPDIPQNTGNIARTCAVTGSKLHIIKPCGFNFDDKTLKRAGLDYWPLLSKEIHESLEDFLRKYGNENICLITTKGDKNYDEIPFESDTFILFGRETAGLPEKLHTLYESSRYRIPMKAVEGARSLNLSNSVAIVLYEGMRRNGFLDLE